jgi:N-acetylmuramoyl-L-alanine amidase CwlA
LIAICLSLGFLSTTAQAEETLSDVEKTSTEIAFIKSKEMVSESIKKEIKLIDKNYNKSIKINPVYIVIHETGNRNIGANADAHYEYWNRDENAEKSTHFVVDEKKALQLLPLDALAWHVGDNNGYSDIKNINSIGIEICVNEDGDYEKARENAIRLVKYLMRELNIDSSRVVRHFDASGKLCPETMIRYPELWDDFKEKIKQSDVIMDEFVPNIVLSSEEFHIANYHSGKDIIENKINFKRFNVNNFDYYIVKNYASRSWEFDFLIENSHLYEPLLSWFKIKAEVQIDKDTNKQVYHFSFNKLT